MKFDRVIIYICLISSFFVFLSIKTSPREVSFSINDKTIKKYHKNKDSIGITSLTLFSVLIPFIIFNIIFRNVKIDLEQELQFYMCFLTCQIFSIAVVENLKNLCGRLRPDFLQRCKPIGSFCTGNYKIVRDGRKSFPSGHSAVAATGFSYAVFFINSKVSLQGNTFLTKKKFVKFFIILIFLLVPILVGCTRYFDNRHHITDIFCGLIIGSVSSRFFYKYSEINVNLEIKE